MSEVCLFVFSNAVNDALGSFDFFRGFGFASRDRCKNCAMDVGDECRRCCSSILPFMVATSCF